MSGLISRAVQRFRAALANAVNASDGPGLIGYGRSVPYLNGTVGAKLGERVGIREFMTQAQWNDVRDETLLVDCASAFAQAHTDLANGDVLELPGKLIRVDSGIVFTKKLSVVGKNKAYATLVGVGLGSDVPILDYQGTTGARIQDIELRRVRFFSDNNLARGLGLTWVNKSNLEDLYFYNLLRGYTGDNAWSNSWKNVSAFGITEETMLLGDECNNNHFDRCEFRGKFGLRAIGGMAGLQFSACDFEGITDANGAGLLLAPAAGKAIRGVFVSSYFENVRGACIETAGVDAGSVKGLVVTGSYLFPGSAAYFGGAAGSAERAVVLANVDGFEFSANVFEDVRSSAFFRSGSEVNGRVHNNTATACPALTNSSNQFSLSVDVQNNFAGRQRVYVSAMPAAGSYTAGDVAENTAPVIDANSLVLERWLRLTTGSNHVLGADWARSYGSHVTPAV